MQFVKYPPSDPEKVREEVQEKIERERKQREHQKAYLEQMKRLQDSAERTRAVASEDSNKDESRGGLWGWLGFQKKSD